MKQALADALAKRGYETLTPVQEAVTDPSLEGADLLVSAQTGSGKTVGFGLAIAPTLLGEADLFEAADKPLALVIAPTRELAQQVAKAITDYGRNMNVTVLAGYGGPESRVEMDFGMKFHVKTMGCKVNGFDSSVIENQMVSAGWDASSVDAADVVIVNTCSVTASSDRDSRYWARRFRKDNPEAFLCFTGCYAQTDADALLKMPEIDLIVPNEVIPLQCYVAWCVR